MAFLLTFLTKTKQNKTSTALARRGGSPALTNDNSLETSIPVDCVADGRESPRLIQRKRVCFTERSRLSVHGPPGGWTFRSVLFLFSQDVWDWRGALYLSDARRRDHLPEGPLCCLGDRWAARACAAECEKLHGTYVWRFFPYEPVCTAVRCDLCAGKRSQRYPHRWLTRIRTHASLALKAILATPKAASWSQSDATSLAVCFVPQLLYVCLQHFGLPQPIL